MTSMTILLTRCGWRSAHEVPVLLDPVAHSTWHHLGSSVDAPPEDQVLQLQVLRVADQLPT